jgi:hypothetical protein
MAHRLVPIEKAKSAVDAEAFVVADTGSQVIPVVGKTEAVEGGWRVEVYSTDGMAHVPLAAGRQYFKVIAISKCGKFARVKDEFETESDVPRSFDSFGETVKLEAGDTISALSAGQGDLREVFVERRADGSGIDWKERPEFDDANGEGAGWTLGVATGPGFSKR